MAPRYGAVEKWFNSPDFLSDIRRFESCRHHHRPRQLSRQSIGLKIRASLVRFQVQAPNMGGWYRGCAVVSKTTEKCSSRLPPANMLCYFSGRRLPLQGRGRWFESTTEYHLNNREKRIRLWKAVGRHHRRRRWTDRSYMPDTNPRKLPQLRVVESIPCCLCPVSSTERTKVF